MNAIKHVNMVCSEDLPEVLVKYCGGKGLGNVPMIATEHTERTESGKSVISPSSQPCRSARQCFCLPGSQAWWRVSVPPFSEYIRSVPGIFVTLHAICSPLASNILHGSLAGQDGPAAGQLSMRCVLSAGLQMAASRSFGVAPHARQPVPTLSDRADCKVHTAPVSCSGPAQQAEPCLPAYSPGS